MADALKLLVTRSFRSVISSVWSFVHLDDNTQKFEISGSEKADIYLSGCISGSVQSFCNTSYYYRAIHETSSSPGHYFWRVFDR